MTLVSHRPNTIMLKSESMIIINKGKLFTERSNGLIPIFGWSFFLSCSWCFVVRRFLVSNHFSIVAIMALEVMDITIRTSKIGP